MWTIPCTLAKTLSGGWILEKCHREKAQTEELWAGWLVGFGSQYDVR
jgi:hypothetical protein